MHLAVTPQSFLSGIIFMLIISSHIATRLNYRMAVSVRSDFLAYFNFPEVYHDGEISKAPLSAAGHVYQQGLYL